MNFATFLVGMVGPLMARWLASVGLSLVAVTGAAASASAIKTLIQGYIGALPAAALQLGGLMGCWEAMGIMFGAFTFMVTWKATSGFWTLAKA